MALGHARIENWTVCGPTAEARAGLEAAMRQLDMSVEATRDGLAAEAARSLRRNRYKARVDASFDTTADGSVISITVAMIGNVHGKVLDEIAHALGDHLEIRERTVTKYEDQERKEAWAELKQPLFRQAAGQHKVDTLSFGQVKVVGARVTTPSGGGPLGGARASVDSAGAIDRRITATRLVLTGPLALGLRKKKDHRELYLLVEGSGFAHVEQADPKYRETTLRFVAEFNKRAAAAVSAEAAPPASTDAHGADPTAQLGRLSELHRTGALTVEEFNDAKRRILDAM